VGTADADGEGSGDGLGGGLSTGAGVIDAADDDEGVELVAGTALHAASTSIASASAWDRTDQRIEAPRDGEVPM
jgi:hypothetical protein